MEEKDKEKGNAVFLVCVLLGFVFEAVAIVYALVLNSLLSHQSDNYVPGFGYDVSSYVAQYLMFAEALAWIGAALIAVGCAVKLFLCRRSASKGNESKK